MGSRSPIRPVEQTTTSPAEISRAAPTFSAVRCTSRKPSGPVHTLAPPELSTTALTTPSETAWRDQTTGAPTTRLVVNTAAAACGRAVVDDEREVRAARGLEAGGDAGGAEAGRRGDTG